MEIRAIRPEEHDPLAELTVRVYESIDATEDGTYVEHLRDVAGRAEHGTVLVAVEDGRIVGGVAFVEAGNPWADISAEGEAELRMLVVDPDVQGRGTGEALVRACIDLAEARGMQRLVLLSNHMMKAAHRLYERLGFTRTPERDWFISENVDLRCYVLRIHQPPGG